MAVLRSTDRGDASARSLGGTKSLQVAKKVHAACQRPRRTRNRRSSRLGPKAFTARTLATYGPENAGIPLPYRPFQRMLVVPLRRRRLIVCTVAPLEVRILRVSLAGWASRKATRTDPPGRLTTPRGGRAGWAPQRQRPSGSAGPWGVRPVQSRVYVPGSFAPDCVCRATLSGP